MSEKITDLPAWPELPGGYGTPPLDWRRQLLFVTDDVPGGAHYLVLRDTVQGPPTHWQMCSTSEKIGTPEQVQDRAAFLGDKLGATILKVSGTFGTDYTFLSAHPVEAAGDKVAFSGTAASVQDRGGHPLLSLGAAGSVNYRDHSFQAEHPASMRVLADALVMELPKEHTGGKVVLRAPGELRLQQPRGEGDAAGHAGRGQVVTGLNDLAIGGTPVLHANTLLWLAGWLPKRTFVEVLVENPRRAEPFRDILVEAYVDRQLRGTARIPAMSRTVDLFSKMLGEFGLTGNTSRADVCGKVVRVPLELGPMVLPPDLGQLGSLKELAPLAPGEHVLDIFVDPKNQFADLVRDNNKYQRTLKIRAPGGTLNVTVMDHNTNAPIEGALVWIKEWYAERTNAQGILQIPDVPAQTYPKEDLSGQLLKPDAYYIEQHPAADFTVQEGATTDVTIRLMKACKVIGVAQNPQGEAITDETVHVGLQGGYCTQAGSGAQFEIPDVLPGNRTFIASAYGYLPLEADHNVTPDADYEYHLTLTMQPGPRGTITGQVTDANGNPLKGVAVWLTGAPRSAETDAAGQFTLANVAAGRSYEVMAMKQGFRIKWTAVNDLQADEIRQVNLELANITYKRRQLSFKATARAQVEASRGLGNVAGWEVTARHGMFWSSLGLLYNTVQGQDTVDQLVVGMEPGPFWWSTVATTWSPTSLISQNIKEVYGGVTSTAFSLVAGLVEKADPIGKVGSYMQGNVDHTELHGGGVVGSYVSTTGAEYESMYAGVSLVDLGGGIPLAGQMAGGYTIVRVDRVVVADENTEKVITRQWRSPKMCIYDINQGFDMDTVEVKVYLSVFNQHGAVGPLAGSSQNVITWRPKDNWTQMVAEPYQVTPE